MAVITVNGIEIVKDGRPQTAIIIPDPVLRPTKLAAEELQTHIKLASGAELKIYPESSKPKEFTSLIYIGACKASFAAKVAKENPPVNYFAGKTVDKDLFLFGDDRDVNPQMTTYLTYMRYMHSGSAFAVYEFLERVLNVRWLWPGDLGVKIDKKRNIVVESLNFSGQPKFISSWFVPRLKNSPLQAWSSLESRTRFTKNTYLWLRRCRFNLANCIMFDHSYSDYWKRFGKTRPGLFNLLPDGTRRPLEGDKAGLSLSMCVSNPELIKQKIADWTNPDYKSWFKTKRPGLQYICASENDTPGMCTCKNCRAWDEPDPRFKTSDYWGKGQIPTRQDLGKARGLINQGKVQQAPWLTARYMHYYLNLYEAAKKVNPEVILVGYVYSNYHKPPQGKIQLNSNIHLSIVPGNGYPTSDESQKGFENDWSAWSKTGAKLIFRPNLPGSGHNMPVSYVNWAYDSITYAHKSGQMIGSMIDSLLGEWGVQGFSYYVIGRLNIDPEMSLQQIYDEYCSAFGPAAGAVEKYWRYWEKVSRDIDIETYHKTKREKSISWKKWLPIAPFIFTPEVMHQGRELLEAAKAVPGLNADETKRLEFLDMGLQNAERTLSVLKLWNAYLKDKNAETRKSFACNLRDLYDFRKKIDSIGLSNTGYLYLREGWSWDKRFLQYASVGSTGITFKAYKTGALSPKGSGWQLTKKDDTKYKITELGGAKVFRLTVPAEDGSRCMASRILFDKSTKDFRCSIVMGWSGDSRKNGVMSRVLLHANSYLWRGVELGFVCRKSKIFAGYRDGEIWRTLGPELNPDVLYRFEIKSSGNKEQCELELLDANDICLEAKSFKPHGGATAVDTVTLLLSSSGNEAKHNVLFVKSIVAVPNKP
ncbi:MAG: DUF4838 domain-containing protein [Lentisphaeria bacterium]